MVAKKIKSCPFKRYSPTGSNTPAMTHFVPSKAYVQVQITVIHIMPFPVTNVHVPVSGSKKRYAGYTLWTGGPLVQVLVCTAVAGLDCTLNLRR